MEQDVFWTLVAFGVLAFAIIGVKILVHTKAQQIEENRKSKPTDTASDDENDS